MVKPELTPSSHDAKDLVGTWTLVSVVAERDGKKFDSYGPNAKGSLVFDANGRYSMIFFLLGAALLIGLGITFWLSQDRRPRATSADPNSRMDA